MAIQTEELAQKFRVGQVDETKLPFTPKEYPHFMFKSSNLSRILTPLSTEGLCRSLLHGCVSIMFQHVKTT